MYFSHGIWPAVVFLGFGMMLGFLIANLVAEWIPRLIVCVLRYVIFPLLVSEKQIRIHEAGHMVAYLRTCTHLKRPRYLRKARRVTEMNQSYIGGDVHIVTNGWNIRNRMLLFGGCAAELKSRGKQINRLRYSIYFWLKGCGSDFSKLRYKHHLSKAEIISYVNMTIRSLTDDDMAFIHHIANELAAKEVIKSGRRNRRMLTQDELFALAQEYYDSLSTVNQSVSRKSKTISATI